MPRRTRLRLVAPAVLVLALGLAIGPAAAAVQGALSPAAQSSPKPSDKKRAEQAVEEAEKRLNAAERDLEQVVKVRKSIRARIDQGKAEVQLASERQALLQREIGARARSAYMRGAPTSISSLLSSDSSADLLDRAELLERIAQHGTTTVSDLRALQQAIDGSRAKLVELERAARVTEKELEGKLAQADKVFDEKARLYRELVRKLSQAEAKRLASRTAQSRVSGVTNSGGACDLSGVPAAAREIIMRESRGIPTAKNPNSTAFGLGQLLISNRQRLIPENPNTTDCGLQYRAFRAYVMERYGSFEAALAFHNSHGWY